MMLWMRHEMKVIGVVICLLDIVIHADQTKEMSAFVETRTDLTFHDGYLRSDRISVYVSSAGDFNGDGLSDVAVGMTGPSYNTYSTAFIVYGQRGQMSATIDGTQLDRRHGVMIHAPPVFPAFSGAAVSAGDLNQDGYDDVLIGAPDSAHTRYSARHSGSAVIVFGKKTHLRDKKGGVEEIFTSKITENKRGLWIYGARPGDHLGCSVSGAGDFNGDGKPDFVIGADGVDRDHMENAGAAYVIFGQGTATTATDIDLTTFISSPTTGFVFYGSFTEDGCGDQVVGVGDVNADGYGDVMVACQDRQGGGGMGQGVAYLLFGHSSGTFTDLSRDDLTPAVGIEISCKNGGDFVGSIAAAGDVNNDGFADIIIGAPWTKAPATQQGLRTGGAFVVFGHAGAFADIDLRQFVSGAAGFRILGAAGALVGIGFNVAGGGDVNGDGYGDVVVSARAFHGIESYVVLGRSATTALTDVLLNPDQGVEPAAREGVLRIAGGGDAVAVVPDFTGDGRAQVLVSAAFEEGTTASAYLVRWQPSSSSGGGGVAQNALNATPSTACSAGLCRDKNEHCLPCAAVFAHDEVTTTAQMRNSYVFGVLFLVVLCVLARFLFRAAIERAAKWEKEGVHEESSELV